MAAPINLAGFVPIPNPHAAIMGYVPGQQTHTAALSNPSTLPYGVNMVSIPIQQGRTLSAQPVTITAAPKQPRVTAKNWVQPTPFTPKDIAEMQLRKMRDYPFDSELALANPVCQSCQRPIHFEFINIYKAKVKEGENPGIVMDNLGIDKPCCRLEYLKQPQIARGIWLLPEEKQSGNKVEVTPKDVVLETAQRPIRPTAISPELLKEGEEIATAAVSGRPRRVIHLTSNKPKVL